MNIISDIYFNGNYAKLYEKIEGGAADIVCVDNEHGTIVSHVIKRQIPQAPDYYDLVTPYGYGGPIITDLKGDKSILLRSFHKAMQQYVIQNNVVSEFVRFHPIFDNALDFSDLYNSELIKQTVVTDLSVADPMYEQFTKRCRKNIRRALRSIDYRVVECPQNLDSFKKIYYATMDRNEAKEYYYFSDEYFDKFLELFKNHILLVEAVYDSKTIAAGMYLLWNDMIHVHLSGTLTEYLPLSPAYVLRYALTEWGMAHGYKLIHHGGGRTNDNQDTLFTFKQQFGEIKLDFYVGKKVWNEEIYKSLCNGSNEGFFPQYRRK